MRAWALALTASLSGPAAPLALPSTAGSGGTPPRGSPDHQSRPRPSARSGRRSWRRRRNTRSGSHRAPGCAGAGDPRLIRTRARAGSRCAARADAGARGRAGCARNGMLGATRSASGTLRTHAHDVAAEPQRSRTPLTGPVTTLNSPRRLTTRPLLDEIMSGLYSTWLERNPCGLAMLRHVRAMPCKQHIGMTLTRWPPGGVVPLP